MRTSSWAAGACALGSLLVGSAHPASGVVVPPPDYRGFAVVLESPLDGAVQGVRLFEDADGPALWLWDDDEGVVVPMGFDPGYGFWASEPSPGAVGPASGSPVLEDDQGIITNDGLRTVLVDPRRAGPPVWERTTQLRSEIVSFSYPYLVWRPGGGPTMLTDVRYDVDRSVAPGSAARPDGVLEIVSQASYRDGFRFTSFDVDVDAASAFAFAAPELGPVADLPCSAEGIGVGGPGLVVYECIGYSASGHLVFVRDVTAPGSQDLSLDVGYGSFQDYDGLPVLLGDEVAVSRIGGTVASHDLRTGERRQVATVPVTASSWAGLSLRAEGTLLASVLDETAVAVEVVGKRQRAPDPFVQWYSERSAPAIGPPVGAPEPTWRGSALPARHGELHAWVDDEGTGRVHEVRGSIYAAWDELGREDSQVGYPVTDEVPLPSPVGAAVNHFQAGSVYFSPATGAHEVRGAIRDTWGRLGWQDSAVGYPLTHEVALAGDAAVNHFANGSIYFSPATGAHEVRGAIRDTWGRLGWQDSAVGYPVTDETALRAGAAVSHFQRGSVYFSPATGAHEVRGAIRDAWGRAGWQDSVLGYPITDEVSLGQSCAVNHFQGGSVYSTQRHGAYVVRGTMRDTWAGTGWQAGRLGYPVTNEERPRDGEIRQTFQGGSIGLYRSPVTSRWQVLVSYFDRPLAPPGSCR